MYLVRILESCVCSLCLLTYCTSYGPPLSARPINLGVMGDSFSDEYRADDNRAGDSYDGKYAATTLNWLELLVKYRNINTGRWGIWGDSRRTGYEYNWALSGSTASDVIQNGQAAGLAEQVRARLITDVILHVGANDFAIWNGTYEAVYKTPDEGGLDDEQIQQKTNEILANITKAVDTIRAAGKVHIIVSNLPDRGKSPYFQNFFPEPVKRRRVNQAVVQVNNGIATMAKAREVYVIDQYGLPESNPLLSRMDSEGNLLVDGVLINFLQDADEPHYVMLADHDHIGTVASGLVANYMFIKALNYFGAGIASFTEQEILEHAGIPLPPLNFTSTKTSILVLLPLHRP